MRILLIVFTLGACATTPAGLRGNEPRATYSSAKGLPALEQCLGESLSFLGGPSVIHGEQAATLSFGDGGITSLMIDIAPPAVTVRTSYPYQASLRRRVEGCL